eukprot:GFYU01007507.1.p1 GENE.GFYU01007507.1~~GFYU01007507.1.p1  ORF type:complete len:290 (-),score=57.04 GFYU01007507.1:82-951(-)
MPSDDKPKRKKTTRAEEEKAKRAVREKAANSLFEHFTTEGDTDIEIRYVLILKKTLDPITELDELQKVLEWPDWKPQRRISLEEFAQAVVEMTYSISNEEVQYRVDKVLSVKAPVAPKTRNYGKIGPAGQAYLDQCEQHKIYPNTEIVNFFNTTENKTRAYDFSGNYIGPEGLLPVVRMIRRNDKVSTINLSGQRIRTDALKFIAETLTPCDTIVDIDLSDNPISYQAFPYIKRLIEMCPKLKSLNLKRTKLDYRHVTGVQRTLDARANPAEAPAEEEADDDMDPDAQE